jgi:hypothetical protein
MAVREFCLIQEDPQEVLRALRSGESTVLEDATDEPADEFVSFALAEGLLGRLASRFPDPRQEPEIPPGVIVAASVAGCFAGLFALYHSGYALRSPRLLAQLGLNARLLEPGEGLSRKGTRNPTPFSGDVLRKLLTLTGKKESAANQEGGTSWPQWFNEAVGPTCLEHTGQEPDIFALDCTKLTVPLDNDRYEGSGIVNDDGEIKRGYKLATLRALLDESGLFVEVRFGPIQQHDLVLARPLLTDSPHLRPGSLLLMDRGFLDGSLIAKLKEHRGVDCVIPLRCNMTAATEAIALTCDDDWQPHPSVDEEQVQLVEDVGHLWEECSVPLNACVIRRADEHGQFQHWVIVTTRLHLSAPYIAKSYALRWELEEDYRQLKDQGWNLDQFTSTKRGTLLYHIVCVLIAYNIYQVYTHTEHGRRFAHKSRRSWRLQRHKDPRTYLLLATPTAYAMRCSSATSRSGFTSSPYAGPAPPASDDLSESQNPTTHSPRKTPRDIGCRPAIPRAAPYS